MGKARVSKLFVQLSQHAIPNVSQFITWLPRGAKFALVGFMKDCGESITQISTVTETDC